MVNHNLTNKGFSEEYLAEIEKYLTAHLIELRSGQIKKKKLGDAETEYTGTFSEGLSSTRFGQNVLVLDTTGTFDNLGKPKAELEVL